MNCSYRCECDMIFHHRRNSTQCNEAKKEKAPNIGAPFDSSLRHVFRYVSRFRASTLGPIDLLAYIVKRHAMIGRSLPLSCERMSWLKTQCRRTITIRLVHQTRSRRISQPSGAKPVPRGASDSKPKQVRQVSAPRRAGSRFSASSRCEPHHDQPAALSVLRGSRPIRSDRDLWPNSLLHRMRVPGSGRFAV